MITDEFGPIKYGLTQPVLMLPTYALGYALGALVQTAEPHRIGYRLTAFIFSPLLVSLICGVWFRTARRLGATDMSAGVGALTLAGSTLLLPYSRLLFSEPLNACLLLLFAAEVVRFETEPDGSLVRAYAPLVALSLNTFVFLPILIAAVAWLTLRESARGRRQAWRALASGTLAVALTAGIWLLYDNARYGAPFQLGYSDEGFTNPLLAGLLGLLVSPGRGLLFYSLPSVVALGCCAALVFRRATGRALRIVSSFSLALFVAYLLLYSTWGSFEGGWCWGPRFLIPFLPVAHFGLIPLLGETKAARRRRAILLVLVNEGNG